MSVEEFLNKIRKERSLLKYYKVLKTLQEKKLLRSAEIERSVVLRLYRVGAVRRIIVRGRTYYMITEKGRELLRRLSDELDRLDTLIKPKALTMTNMEWVIRTIIKLHEEGIETFNKGLFFKKLYELIDELNRKGYVFKKPLLVSIDRCLRMAVELGLLERSGSKKNPRYTITPELMKKVKTLPPI